MPNKYLDSVGLAEYTSLIKGELAPKASPAFTGTPTAPTPTAGDDSTKIATTEFVQDTIDAEETRADGAYLPFTGGSITGNLSVSGTITGDVTGDLTGNADTATTATNATNATNDGNGDEIATTYLPLSGGTMTRAIISKATAITNSSDNSYTQFNGATTSSNGAILALFGKDNSGAGAFSLRANNGTTAKHLDGKPDGTLTWGGHNVITSALTGTILSASGNATTVNAYGTLCSITTHPAGVFLITSFLDLSYSGTGFYINNIQLAIHSGVATRNTADGGGGNCAVLLTALNENETVSLRGYQIQSGTMQGRLYMVQLA